MTGPVMAAEIAIVPIVAKKNKKQKIVESKPSENPTDKLNEFFQLMETEHLNELEISMGSFHVKLVRQSTHAVHVSPLAHAPYASEAPKAAAPKPEEPTGISVKSPIAGVFYRARSPQSPPFVAEGASVKIDQPLCIIEAMKVMNEITAKVDGRISKILVENGKPVEADQTLFIIQPT